MTSYDDEKRREQEEARVRSILGPRATDDPKKKRELEKEIAAAREKRKTGNFALMLLAALAITALFAVFRYLTAN